MIKIITKRKTNKCGPKIENLTARIFGNWIVIKDLGIVIMKNGNRRHKCECQCKCGNIQVVDAGNLKNSSSKSCKSCAIKNMWKLEKGKASFNLEYGRYIKSAKRRGLKFSLTKEQFRKITSSNCHYCGVEPKQYSKQQYHHGRYLHNGIDRKNNKEGYTIENSLPCCKCCNFAKRAMSYQEYIKYIGQLAIYQVKKNPSLLEAIHLASES